MDKNKKSEKAMNCLMKALEYEAEHYDSSADPKERAKSAAAMSLLADKIQKLEDSENVKRSGDRDFWLKVAGITASTGLGVAGMVQTQKNLNVLTRFEDENVVRTTSDRFKASNGLKVGEFLDRTGSSILRMLHF